MTAKGLTTSNLIEAVRAGRLSGVINALDQGADIETPDMHGCRGLPLRAACFEGKLAVVRELLSHGANPNAAASDGPGAALRLALRKGHREIVALLLQQGAQIPEGTVIDPEIFLIECAPLAVEAHVPSLPDARPDKVIEFSPAAMTLPVEDMDISATFGTETNAMSMDLLFLEDNEAHHASPPPAGKH